MQRYIRIVLKFTHRTKSIKNMSIWEAIKRRNKSFAVYLNYMGIPDGGRGVPLTDVSAWVSAFHKP
ncbi:hypothetical protein ACI01nite_26760 [Acetobacter cibinongensis]|uniref:Uncharacterized protein n=1 Tax=Acetobacter cibinongensis TaxID=146475 RepID=A0A0D6N694_9PROT|nr:hypothetical protein Abci_036_014 [Acetobacter cibinongensis]GEL60074.1 hypothetical protein ACI01nite_26760 [Acetobacter cibinongensis]